MFSYFVKGSAINEQAATIVEIVALAQFIAVAVVITFTLIIQTVVLGIAGARDLKDGDRDYHNEA